MLIEDQVEYVVKFTGGQVQGGDDIRWVRKDLVDDNSGNECSNADFNALSVTPEVPDHGGKVYECDDSHNCISPADCSAHDFPANSCADKGAGVYTQMRLDGDVDTVHPLNTTNRERTGALISSELNHVQPTH